MKSSILLKTSLQKQGGIEMGLDGIGKDWLALVQRFTTVFVQAGAGLVWDWRRDLTGLREFTLFLGGSAQPQPYSTFGINKQENAKSLKRWIGPMRMQRKL